MEAVKQWAFSLCAAMVACGLAGMLLPHSGLEKMFRTTVSVFFLCCLLSPIVLRDPGLRIELQQSSQQEIDRRAERLRTVAYTQAEQEARRELKNFIGQKLGEMGINYYGITINMDTNGQSGEQQPQVEILLDHAHEHDHETIRAELERQLELGVRLHYIPATAEGG